MTWNFRLDFRDSLGEGESQDDMRKAVAAIRLEIGRKLPESLVKQAERWLAEMDDAADQSKIDWFNTSLDRLWDFFDSNRIWVKV